MSKEEQNKALVGRWFTEFWGPKVNLSAVDELAAPQWAADKDYECSL